MRIFYVTALILLLTLTSGFGQVDAGDDITISAGLPVLLEGRFTGYQAMQVTAQDDYFVGPFPIGFTFEYFGTPYTEFAIGPNGLVSFNLPDILDVVHWTSVTIPNSVFEATIMGPYQDLFQRPGAPHNQFIYYTTVGEEPNRKLIVGWCEAPMFSCDDLRLTAQIVMEESGVIRNHLINKPACEANLGNKATQGLNFDDVTGVVVPGRNATSWSAKGETWLFTPDGPDNYLVTEEDFEPEPAIPPGHISFAWYKDNYPGGEKVSSADAFLVHPSETTTYYCEVTLCGGVKYVDDITIKTIPVPNAFNPDSPVEENRTFRLFAEPVEGIRNFRMVIFDRWGREVFETTDITVGWDGTYSGSPANAGVYIWSVFYQLGDELLTNKGTVTLVR
ncbi:MAG: hypothetical protein Kow00127_07510 [Bacteroidales bacterium]